MDNMKSPENTMITGLLTMYIHSLFKYSEISGDHCYPRAHYWSQKKSVIPFYYLFLNFLFVFGHRSNDRKYKNH